MFHMYGQRVLNDPKQATGTISELGGAPSSVFMSDYNSNLIQVGFPSVSAAARDQRRWLRMYFENVPLDAPDKVTVIVTQHFEDYRDYSRLVQQRSVLRVRGTNDVVVYAYLGDPVRRPVGHHWAFVHNKDGERIAGLEYEVVP